MSGLQMDILPVDLKVSNEVSQFHFQSCPLQVRPVSDVYSRRSQLQPFWQHSDKVRLNSVRPNEQSYLLVAGWLNST
jgi:hypothetical protein